jgi:hypothetical protein
MDHWKDVPGLIEKSNTETVSGIRKKLADVARTLNSLASKDKEFKRAEVLIDKARSILFELQD